MSAAAVARVPNLVDRTATPPPPLSLNTNTRGSPTAVPNKHIPTCPTGPAPSAHCLETPPATPARALTSTQPTSLLYPPPENSRISDDPPLFSITADRLAAALDEYASTPLPEPQEIFPWLHGLHPENQIQVAFFIARRKAQRKVPKCLRCITIVKAGGDMSRSRLKGAVGPGELLIPSPYPGDSEDFLEADPKEGFSVRNFHTQTTKIATVSDIVVYGDDKTSRDVIMRLATRLANAQLRYREKEDEALEDLNNFNTFVLTDSYSTIASKFPDLVAANADGQLSSEVMDFGYWERAEMTQMSAASEIAENVFLGPTPDPTIKYEHYDQPQFDVLLETSDISQIPEPRSLAAWKILLAKSNAPQIRLDFPSSGSIMPPTWSQSEVDGLLNMCRWIYQLANPSDAHLAQDTSAPYSMSTKAWNPPRDDQKSEDMTVPLSPRDTGGDVLMSDAQHVTIVKPKSILIHCADGYTESTLLGLAYYMYANAVPAHEAWVTMHRDLGRNFFAYASDVALLTTMQTRILQESPRWRRDSGIDSSLFNSESAKILRSLQPPDWLCQIDGSLPSRVMPYMYLGNLNHASNPEMLRKLGITRILSVGEPLAWAGQGPQAKDAPRSFSLQENFAPRAEQWSEIEQRGWKREDFLYIDCVQDNGVDPLTPQFERCLQFIEQGKRDGTATLVHCRVGVSRSATICIAEVMKELSLSFPHAYCFVRARRLNVIIQPHLRFVYELLKWEEHLRVLKGLPLRREHEWQTIAREIALMNKPYSRQ